MEENDMKQVISFFSDEEVIELLMDTESPTVEEIIYELERDDDVH